MASPMANRINMSSGNKCRSMNGRINKRNNERKKEERTNE